METYKQLKKRHADESFTYLFDNSFIVGNKTDLERGLERLGITKENAANELVLMLDGMFFRKSALAAYSDMGNRHEKELRRAITHKVNGRAFLSDAFLTELEAHKDFEIALSILDLSPEEVNRNPVMMAALIDALAQYEGEEDNDTDNE